MWVLDHSSHLCWICGIVQPTLSGQSYKHFPILITRRDIFSGQSYKHFTLVNYDSRVVPDWKIPHITTLES